MGCCERVCFDGLINILIGVWFVVECMVVGVGVVAIFDWCVMMLFEMLLVLVLWEGVGLGGILGLVSMFPVHLFCVGV